VKLHLYLESFSRRFYPKQLKTAD